MLPPLNPPEKMRWRWSVLAAFAMMLLSLIPQMHLWLSRGGQWQGAYAYLDTDEGAYSAYVNALINGRPRRNDPYTGRDDALGASQPESLFSIQFVPAYAIAIPARVLGVSASTAFIALLPITAFASSLVVFWLIAMITNNDRLAGVGVLLVLCLGTSAAGDGWVGVLLGGFLPFERLPFLRRYQPSVSFPLFFLLCGFMWRALCSEKQRIALTSAVTAGLIFALLVFSYFYLWTAAAAWLAGLALLWVTARSSGRQRAIALFSVVCALMISALLPYFIMLSHRGETMDSVQALETSHAPDLLRLPELLGYIILVVLIISAWRGRIIWRDHAFLFAVSFAVTPFIVFNQQIITGRSLQPLHYEGFIANYVVLIAAVLAIAIVSRRLTEVGRKRFNRVLLQVATIAFVWGMCEVIVPTLRSSELGQDFDREMPVFMRLAELGERDGSQSPNHGASDPRPVVLSTHLLAADRLATVAPQGVLWALHMNVFNVALAEDEERFFQYLYYTGITEYALNRMLAKDNFTLLVALFGNRRAYPPLTINSKPIALEERRDVLHRYSNYIASFTKERAARPTLSYVITPTEGKIDLSNLDRWYERDAGERIGEFTLYRVKLRP